MIYLCCKYNSFRRILFNIFHFIYRILVFLLLLPLLLFSIYCSTFGKKPIGLPFGVVTYEVDNIRDCGNNFTTSSFVEIASRLDCYVTQPLSCLYLEYMQKEDVKLVSFNIFVCFIFIF